MSSVNSDNGIRSLGASAARRCTLALVVCALLVVSWHTAPDTRAAITAADDAVTTEINTAASFDVLDNDGAGLTVVDHSQVSHGELSDNDDGVFDYLPHANFTGPDAFTYTVEDDSGARATATVIITVTGEVTGVEARDDSATTDEDVPVWLSLRANDGAGPDNLPLTYSIETSPTHGEVALEVDGSLSYAPASNWSGSDELTYTVTDGVSTDTATFSIEVASVSDTPDAVDDAILTDQGHAVEIEILANDSDADGDEFWFVEHSAPLNGTVRWSDSDRMMTYEPNPDVFGVDSFTYTITDDDGPDTATVTVTIDGKPTGNDNFDSEEP